MRDWKNVVIIVTMPKLKFWVRKQRKYPVSQVEKENRFVDVGRIETTAAELGFTRVLGKNEFILVSGE